MSPGEVYPSHAAFAEAARSFVEARSHPAASESTTDALEGRIRAATGGWRWAHPAAPYARGYLTRSQVVHPASPAARALAANRSSPLDDAVASVEPCLLMDEDGDPSTAICPPAVDLLRFTCHIVYSATYRGPQLLMSAYSLKSGTPASLDTLVASGLIRPPGSAVPDGDGIAIQLRPEVVNGAAFPLLSLAEHPATGETLWALHPCHLAEAVNEILTAEHTCKAARTGEHWLETWLMVVGLVVDLSRGS